MTDDRSSEEWAKFRTEILEVLNKYAHVVGPQDGDEGIPVNNKETMPTDVFVVTNWLDMDTSNGFLCGYAITKSNPSMLLGMLMRVADTID